MRKLVLALVLALFLYFKAQPVLAQERLVTVVNPVRSRVIWQDINWLDQHIQAVKDQALVATWLIQYDVLSDDLVINKLTALTNDEVGLFLEVSEWLATDARVAYLQGEGDYYRPDKVFLSSYSLEERLRLIDQAMTKFKTVLGNYPTSVGAWYLDPFSLEYLVNKYQVEVALVCADQWQTDKYQLWGQPWGVPFYPSKYNSLIPAGSLKDKIDLVLIQWALRDPVLAFGTEVANSTYSLQANDYLGHHGLDLDYFQELLGYYLNNDNPINQVTVGLEVGETRFMDESVFNQFEQQLALIKKLGLISLTMTEFAQSYKQEFELMPATEIKAKGAIWQNRLDQRQGWLEENGELKLIDERVYQPVDLSPDLTRADKSQRLERQVPTGLVKNQRLKKLMIQLRQAVAKVEQRSFGGLRWSRIDERLAIGIWWQPNEVCGFKLKPLEINCFEYPFQTLVRFKGWQ